MLDEFILRGLPPDELRRFLALRLAVQLRSSDTKDVTSGYVTRTARMFEMYLQNGAVER